MAIIEKIRLINFKRFRDYIVMPNKKINIFVGDNEVGKSTILEAIDIVARGSINRIEKIGLDKLLNIDAVNEFKEGKRTFENLPTLKIELYLSGNFDFTMNGKNNEDGKVCDGIRLICEPNPDYRNAIVEALEISDDYFPYDYYSIRFSTFADEAYIGYRNRLRSVMINSSNMNSDYATNDFVRRMYLQYTEDNMKERTEHKSNYRRMRNEFRSEIFKTLNERVPSEKNYAFGLKSGSSVNLMNDLMIYENEIGIDNKGTGKQIFIKTDFALEHSGDNGDIILIEEPENHLSHVNLRKLIKRVIETQSGQLFITTHNSLISTRLELNNLLIMHINGENKPVILKDLSEETAKYFMKAPPASIVEYALSKKVMLVEGPSEYMLLDNFYKTITGNSPEDDDVHIIDIRGLSFKRYLEIANLTGSKVAVLTDNDRDYDKNCVKKYDMFRCCNNIKIFFEENNKKRTFEVVLYEDNKSLCDKMFGENALGYMLDNKTEAAYNLLQVVDDIIVPNYMKRAIEWIKE